MGMKFMKSSLGVLDVFSKTGSESVVYQLPCDFTIRSKRGPYLYKEYKDTVLDGRKPAMAIALDRLVDAYEKAHPKNKSLIDRIAAWPLVTVGDNMGATGFIMRELNASMIRPDASDSGVKVLPLEKWVQPEKKLRDRARRQGYHPMSQTGKRLYIERLFNYYSMIHSMGWVVGDISLNNILAYVPAGVEQDIHCSPAFIEIDTYRNKYTPGVMKQRHTFEFRPPEYEQWRQVAKRLKQQNANDSEIMLAEAKANIQSQESDVFKAVLLALKLVDCGPSPTQAHLQPTSIDPFKKLFGDQALRLIEAALDNDPRNRPTMYEIAKALTSKSL